MRRKIELYINGSQADISDQGLVLFNYAFTDLENPTAVKNSYSKQITLPGTPNNAIIFDHFANLTHTTGVGFNPLVKTPFTIYNERSEILESGYLRLDSVIRKGSIVTGYKVSLFGGLGSFFYALSYDGDGNKRTLADLVYLTGAVNELDFKINATAVSSAWSRLFATTAYDNITSKWDVINFAPAYNGIPDNFSADKALVKATSVGLAASVTEDGVTYNARSDGSVLVNLSQAHTEWEVKDLRSYLQRPVLRMRAFLDAICNPANNGGYEVEIDSDLYDECRTIWKTLPTLPSLSASQEDEGEYTLTANYSTPSAAKPFPAGRMYINESVGAATDINATIQLQIYCNTSYQNTTLYPSRNYREIDHGHATNYSEGNVIFMQLIAYDSNNVALAASKVKILSTINTDAETLITNCNFTPVFAGSEVDGAVSILGSVTTNANGRADLGTFTFQVSAQAVAYYRLVTSIANTTNARGTAGSTLNIEWSTSPSTSDSFTSAIKWGHSSGDWYTLSYHSQAVMRSGALIKKANLLASKHTPAEYLISLVKILGGVFTYDTATKKVSILSRNAFYGGIVANPIDLTSRVDRGREIAITPMLMTSKWYEFILEQAQGTFAQEYKNIYGQEYGIQRVNTGYDFDAAAINAMKDNAFRQAVTCLEHGPYYCDIKVSGSFRPPVFIDAGNTYTLWSSVDGKGKEFEVFQPPSSAVIEYINEYGHQGYDNEFAWKLQLHDADNKGIDGEDILVYYSGRDTYPYFKISDDDSLMGNLNGGKMCWDLNPGSSAGIAVADFHRYDTDTEWGVEVSLDFGIPMEVDIPSINFFDNCNRYARSWAAFIRDRYNQDTKVMKCRVNFQGLQVGPELLRRFFYYEGVYWVLNKISNYSLTTWDPVECEFIQVQDKDNYTNGQILT